MSRSRDDDDDDDRPRRRSRRSRDDDDDDDDRPLPRRVPRRSGGTSPMVWVGIGIGGLLLLLLCAGIGIAVVVARGGAGAVPNLAGDNTARVKNGMSQKEVEAILGSPGRVVSTMHIGGQEHRNVHWEDGHGTTFDAGFVNDRLTSMMRVHMGR
jgi:hypothetical protein